MNGGDDGRAAARGVKLCADGRTGERRCRSGSEEEEEREKVRRTDLKFLESSRASR
jgi:hypothetical protein